jgi:Flp pilus assembly protein TadG
MVLSFAGNSTKQRGAAAVEFTLVFPLFFLLFYGLVTWGLILNLQDSMSYAAQVAARASIAADPQDPNHPAIMQELARTTAAEVLGWLPETWKARVLGESNQQVEVTLVTDGGVDWVRVRIIWPNFRDDPMLPLMRFPGGVTLPPVPDQLLGEAVIRL